MGRSGPKTAEGIAAVTRNIMAANAAGLNRRPGPSAIRAITPARPEAQEVSREILALLEGAEVDHVRPADQPTVELLGTLLAQVRAARGYLAANTLVDHRGRLRGVAQLLPALVREARGCCDALGLSPAGRAKLGLAAGRAFNLAEELAATQRRRGGAS